VGGFKPGYKPRGCPLGGARGIRTGSIAMWSGVGTGVPTVEIGRPHLIWWISCGQSFVWADMCRGDLGFLVQPRGARRNAPEERRSGTISSTARVDSGWTTCPTVWSAGSLRFTRARKGAALKRKTGAARLKPRPAWWRVQSRRRRGWGYLRCPVQAQHKGEHVHRARLNHASKVIVPGSGNRRGVAG
jgi:hypothetical protein